MKPLTPAQVQLLTHLAKPQTRILTPTDNPATIVWRISIASIRRERQALLDAAGELTVAP